MKTVVIGAMALVLVAGPTTAKATGAFAIGMTADVAKDGFAYGMASDLANEAQARAAAIDKCKTSSGGASAKIRSLCRVVGVFRGECVSIAWDPGEGTPGVGWAIGLDRASTERDALGMCQLTAGDRVGNCVVEATRLNRPTAAALAAVRTGQRSSRFELSYRRTG